MLVGIQGQSSRGDGYWRLYLTLQFDEYVDIRKTDVAGSRPIPNDSSPLGRIAIWMPIDAEVYYTRVDARSLQASFLQGEIARAHAPQAGEAGPFLAGSLLGVSPGCRTASQGCERQW